MLGCTDPHTKFTKNSIRVNHLISTKWEVLTLYHILICGELQFLQNKYINIYEIDKSLSNSTCFCVVEFGEICEIYHKNHVHVLQI